ncbi:MAG: tetratricopeptide repeat protein [Verrucomicrobia bacterium]|nr:tetratricopeptide repeat protein [Verrucomicrobiota bacterium]
MNQEQAAQPQTSTLLDFLAWIEVNKQRLLYGAGGVLVLGLGIYAYQHIHDQAEARASAALLAATQPGETGAAIKPDADKLLRIASEHAGTAAGRRALLLGAKELFTEKKFDAARSRFEQYLAESPEAPGAPTAALGVAACLDASNQLDPAISAYQRVIGAYPTTPEAVQAQLAMALLHEAKNQPDQALKTYDEILRARRQSVWSSEANMRRDLLLSKNPQLSPTNIIVQPKPALAPSAVSNAVKVPLPVSPAAPTNK